MTFSSNTPWIFLLVALAILAPLAWIAWKGLPERLTSTRFLAVGCRVLGIVLILFALTDPRSLLERPVSGANLIALLSDNSQGLRIKDYDALLDRGEQARQYLSGRSSQWRNDLSDTYQIRNYSFDTGLHRISSFDSLDFSGAQSNLNAALSQITDRLERLPLAGIVAFSDGNATDEPLSDEDLKKLPPIYPVILGNESALPDLSLNTVNVSQSAFGDSPLQVKVELAASGVSEDLKTRTVIRQLKARNSSGSSLPNFVEEKTSSVSSRSKIDFEWTPSKGGVQFYEIETEQILDTDSDAIPEATLANNRRVFMANRGKDSYRILYITGRPNWEYKFLNRSLAADSQLSVVGLIRVASREPNFEFKGRAGENSNSLYRGFGREDETERYDEAVLIRMNTRDEHELRTGFPNDAATLFAYDALIIDDLEADFFSFSQQALIRDFVKQRGGGLLVLGGVNSLEDGGYENTPIAQTLPLYLDRYGPPSPKDRAVHWNLTRDGWVEPWVRIRPVENDEKLRMMEMPRLRVYNTLQRIKPGATALASIEDSSSEAYPALVTQNFGSGRVATLAVGDLWRWGMQNQGSQADLAQFWRQISRWLVKDNPQRVELNARTNGDGSIQLNAVAREADFQALQAGNAKVYVKQLSDGNQLISDAIELELNLKAVNNEPGRFSLRLPLEDEGAFHARVEVSDAEGLVVGEAETGWVNQPLVTEFASLSPNLEYLEDIANKTGGKVLQLSELDQLANIIEANPSPITESYSHPLWHNNWLFLLALAAFLTEWLLRRKRGLA